MANEPPGITCVAYDLYDSTIPGVFTSTFIQMLTPLSLTLGPTTGSEIGTLGSKSYSIKVRATVPATSVVTYWDLTINVINPCASATVTAGSLVPLSYTVGAVASTTGAVSFTISPSNCAVSYSQSYSPSNPSSIFSFPNANTLQVGPSTDLTTASTTPYTVSVTATVSYASTATSATQSFSVNLPILIF